jgi:DNA repair ATPase RecN
MVNIEDFAEYEDEATETPQTISDLAKKAKEIDEELHELEIAYKTKQHELRVIKEVKIPEALAEIGCTEFKCARSGFTIRLSREVKASIVSTGHEEAYKFLIDNNYGTDIKAIANVSCSTENKDRLAGLLLSLKKDLPDVDIKTKVEVHHARLNSIVKDLLENGQEVPSCFSKLDKQVAKITYKKG